MAIAPHQNTFFDRQPIQPQEEFELVFDAGDASRFKANRLLGRAYDVAFVREPLPLVLKRVYVGEKGQLPNQERGENYRIRCNRETLDVSEMPGFQSIGHVAHSVGFDALSSFKHQELSLVLQNPNDVSVHAGVTLMGEFE